MIVIKEHVIFSIFALQIAVFITISDNSASLIESIITILWPDPIVKITDPVGSEAHAHRLATTVRKFCIFSDS